ncbi:MAG: hypothetical protein COC01_09220 [Bacteroidetes bacterium]|nr:MAG: hypothetical protein COC01_09220 [Bacteroidota bacterium]
MRFAKLIFIIQILFLAITNAQVIDGGSRHAIVICNGCGVWATGGNEAGQLGDSSQTKSLYPIKVLFSDAISVVAAYEHTMALKNDRTVWAWGDNGAGQLGVSTTNRSLIPIQVSGISDIKKISAFGWHSMALGNDGIVWVWGRNDQGELGNGTTTRSNIPITVSQLSDIVDIAAASGHSMALQNDGTVWAWGYNFHGQVGDGTTTDRHTPVKVSTLSNITAICVAVYHSMAIAKDSTVWSWGRNNNGTLGDGSQTDRSTPVQTSGLKDIIALAAGVYHSLALRDDGTVWAWGYNGSGQVGDTEIMNVLLPLQVFGLNNIVEIAAGNSHSMALQDDGTVWTWGQNDYGQYGDSTVISSNIPKKMQLLCNVEYPNTPEAEFSYSNGCRGDSTVFKFVSEVGLDSLTWYFGDPVTGDNDTSYLKQPSHYYENSMNYSVTLSINKGCYQDKITKSIFIDSIPKVSLGQDSFLCESATIVLDAGNSVTNFLWSTGDTTQEINVMYGNYHVVVNNECGSSADTIDITNRCDSIDVPNVFTPNGDLVHDEFKIKLSGYIGKEILIFNRWGQLVFKTSDPASIYWNGTTKNSGMNLIEGVYFYVLNYKDRDENLLHATGIVSLIR